jgi:hypothetical protein
MIPHLGRAVFVFLKGDKVTGKDVKITPQQLAKAMDADYQKLVQLVSGAVNGAPDGAVISGSEELACDAMARYGWTNAKNIGARANATRSRK